MCMHTDKSQEQLNKESLPSTAISWQRLLMKLFIMMGLTAGVLFGSSGHLDWGMAWVYIGMVTIFTVCSRIVLLRKHPDLIIERAESFKKDNVKSWDKVLMPLIALVGPVIILTIAGLDLRFEWTGELPLSFQFTGLFMTLIGFLWGVWATVVNTFFSAVVCIQQERGHTVITSGPYQYMRHPGYAGGVLAHCGTPIMLGSLWALIPSVTVVCALVVRTALEDKILLKELDGYRDYASMVRYRLLPGVW